MSTGCRSATARRPRFSAATRRGCSAWDDGSPRPLLVQPALDSLKLEPREHCRTVNGSQHDLASDRVDQARDRPLALRPIGRIGGVTELGPGLAILLDAERIHLQ